MPDRAGSSVPVHYSRVVCGGTESRLENCSLNRVSGSIDHLSDVFIVCRPTFDISMAAYSGEWIFNTALALSLHS